MKFLTWTVLGLLFVGGITFWVDSPDWMKFSVAAPGDSEVPAKPGEHLVSSAGRIPIELSGPVAINKDNSQFPVAKPGSDHTVTILDQLQRISRLVASGQSVPKSEIDSLLNQLHKRPGESLAAFITLLADHPGTDAVWQQDLSRHALLALLFQFEHPDVEWIAQDLLLQSPSPSEVHQIGRYLQDNWPHKHTSSIQFAVQQALNSGVSQDSTGALFQLLGETGNTETLQWLLETPVNQDAYASVAMAMLPDGSGIEVLEQDARLFEAGLNTLHGRLAIELLALVSPGHDRAGDVLVDLAIENAIPVEIWPHVLALVSGNWILTLEQPAQGTLETHTIYRPEGKQVIYRVYGNTEYKMTFQESRLKLLDRLAPFVPQMPGTF